jgi:lipoprotein-anchoring transpeptidase ErfK/SrfK
MLRALLAAGLTCTLFGSAVEAQTESPSPPVAVERLGKPTRPPDARGRRVLAEAGRQPGLRILVSTEDRWLWLVKGRDTLMSVPVAVGMGRFFEFEGKRFWFETPRGRRKVLKKEPGPIWNVPEWHYLERAASRGYGVVRMDSTTKYMLADSSFLVTMGGQVGRLNQLGNFWPVTPGLEIMFDEKVFIPPPGTPQRLVPDALGPYKLDTGEGYLIHGTHIYNEQSVGEAVSHGCVRLRNPDLEVLYERVPTGTPVFIF